MKLKINKYYLLTFLLLLNTKLIYAGSVQGISDCPLEEAEEKECYVKTNKGKKEGVEICRALDNPSIILREANYSAGLLNGPFICRSFTNKVIVKTNYRNGKIHGEYRDYSTNRSYHDIKEAWDVKYFDNGKQVGVEFYGSNDGKVLDVIPQCYIDGQMDSTYFTSCLDVNYAEYDKGVKEFINKEIKKHFAEMNKKIEAKYSNGKPKLIATLKDGKYDGAYQRYYENGKIELDAFYKNGELLSQNGFYESGAKNYVSSFEGNKIRNRQDFYENTKKKFIATYDYKKNFFLEHVLEYTDREILVADYTLKHYPGDYWYRYEGLYRLYNDEGKLVTESTYVDDKLQGKSTYIGDKKHFEEIYDKGKIISAQIFDSKTNKLLEKIEYMPDGSEKTRVVFP
jgi:antitoxin component YwqK of YwqJK toxin-antitoxin module